MLGPLLYGVADHASDIGANPQRVAVGGDSAGGLLAAWVAQKAAKEWTRFASAGAASIQISIATTSRPSWKELGYRRVPRFACPDERMVRRLSTRGDKPYGPGGLPTLRNRSHRRCTCLHP